MGHKTLLIAKVTLLVTLSDNNIFMACVTCKVRGLLWSSKGLKELSHQAGFKGTAGGKAALPAVIAQESRLPGTSAHTPTKDRRPGADCL